jgi:putative nucleotidyltransferase with HDIG domain
MSEAVEFLQAFARALAVVALYPSGHVTRRRALDATYQHLQDLFAVERRPIFSFLGTEVVLGSRPLRDLRDWEWGGRLAGIGMQRLEFDSSVPISVVELDALMDSIVSRLTLRPTETAAVSQERETGIRFGTVGVGDESELQEEPREAADNTAGTFPISLRDEADAVGWLHEVLRDGGELPLAEAESVVRSLTATMHGDQEMILPLLRLRGFDEYTTTHSVNVSVLSMGLAEWLGLGGKDVRAVGVAALLHDLGKVKIPKEILNKPGKFNARELEVMRSHATEGARMILTSDQQLDLAASVAYEHHIMIDGGGYPSRRYPRDCHFASRLVHVCDVYDALRTTRPYRESWPAKKVMEYIAERAGTEFDDVIARAFVGMMEEREPRLATFREDEEVAPSAEAAPADAASAALAPVARPPAISAAAPPVQELPAAAPPVYEPPAPVDAVPESFAEATGVASNPTPTDSAPPPAGPSPTLTRAPRVQPEESAKPPEDEPEDPTEPAPTIPYAHPLA